MKINPFILISLIRQDKAIKYNKKLDAIATAVSDGPDALPVLINEIEEQSAMGEATGVSLPPEYDYGKNLYWFEYITEKISAHRLYCSTAWDVPHKACIA